MIAHPGPWKEDDSGNVLDANGEIVANGDSETGASAFADDYAKAVVFIAPAMLALMDRVQSALSYRIDWTTKMKIVGAIREAVKSAKGSEPKPAAPWDPDYVMPAQEMDPDGWRKRYEAAANELSEIRLQVGRHNADEEIRRENCRLNGENITLQRDNKMLKRMLRTVVSPDLVKLLDGLRESVGAEGDNEDSDLALQLLEALRP